MKPPKRQAFLKPIFIGVILATLTSSALFSALPGALAQEGLSVALEVNNSLNTDRIEELVTSGIPLPQSAGIFSTENLNMVDEDGTLLPSQFTVTARWGGGPEDTSKPIRWILATFPSTIGANSTEHYTLTEGTKNTTSNGIQLLSNTDEEMIIDTGKAQFTFNKKEFSLFKKVKIGDKTISNQDNSWTLKDLSGEVYTASNAPTQISFQEQGPLRWIISLEGTLKNSQGKASLDYLAHLYFYAGKSDVRVFYTAGNHNEAAVNGCCSYDVFNYYGKNSITFEDLSGMVSLHEPQNALTYTFPQGETFQTGTLSGNLNIYQDSSGKDYWNRYNSTDNPRPNSYSTFRGYKVYNNGSAIDSGDQFKGWMDVSDQEKGITVGMVNFWQNFPKAFSAQNDGSLKIHLYPEDSAGAYNFRVGEEKTTELFLHFHEGEDSRTVQKQIEAALDPLQALATPEWYASSGALGKFIPENTSMEERIGKSKESLNETEKYAYYNDRTLEADSTYSGNYFDTFHSLWKSTSTPSSIDYFNTHGWASEGNQPLDFEAYGEGKAGFFNTKYDFSWGAWIQFLRTGESDWGDMAESFSRGLESLMLHDVVTDTGWDIARWKNAVFGHSNHDEPGNTNGVRNTLGPVIDTAFNAEGALLHYYLTGHLPSKRYADKIGKYAYDFYLNQYQGEPLWNGKERPYGNVLSILVTSYRATGEEHYQTLAENVIEYLAPEKQPYINGPILDDTSNFTRPWMLGMYLTALGRYIEVTKEFGKTAESQRAQAILVQYVDWMLKYNTFEWNGYLTTYYSYNVNGQNEQGNDMLNNWMLLLADATTYAYVATGNSYYLETAGRFFKTGVDNPFFEGSKLIYSSAKEAVNHAVFGHVYLYYSQGEEISDSGSGADSGSGSGSSDKDYESHWAKPYIETLFQKKIVSGCGNGNFCPDQAITRSEFLKMVVNAYEISLNFEGENRFKDVSKTHWAYDYIITSAELGLIQGYEDQTFHPDQSITRAEAVKILLIAAGKTLNASIQNPFEDLFSNSWYFDDVLTAYDAQWIEGYLENGKRHFKPSQPMTRAEVAKLILVSEPPA